MSANSHINLSTHYCVEDIPGAKLPATRIISILEKFQQGRPLTPYAHTYLQRLGLLALRRHINGESTFDEFRLEAKAEQTKRKQKAKTVRLTEAAETIKKEAERQAKINLTQEKLKAARIAREQNPKYIAREKNKALRARYGLDTFIDEDCFFKLMNILRRLDSKQRLSEKDVLWLSTEGDEYYSEEVRAAYHWLEAKFYSAEFKNSNDPWLAINASSHYRKANRADIAGELLKTIDIEKKKSSKIKSAFYTTYGGVKRDLKRTDEAIQLGKKAHKLMPKDFRPCTLLGAIYMENHEHTVGQEWYTKALERGANQNAINSDLRSIYMRADKSGRAKLRAHLLNVDPECYRWVNSLQNK